MTWVTNLAGLTWANSSLFFNRFFFSFIFQHGIYWELGFIIYFNFLSTGLSWSHEPGCGFGMLTWVDSSHFFNYFFLISSFNIGLWKIRLYNLFWLAFYDVIIVSQPNIRIGKLTRIDLICCHPNIYIKKISSWIFILSQIMFLSVV
jgi:hypothetical protein